MSGREAGPEYREEIAALRRRARRSFDVHEEVTRLRRRIATETEKSHRGLLERIAAEAGVDLPGILEEARRRRGARRRYVDRTLERLEAEASERVSEEGSRDHGIRASYLDAFGDALAAREGETELKFRDPIDWAGEARPGDCIVGGWDADPGSYQASAEIARSPDTPGMWLYPRLRADSRDCDDAPVGRTLQDLTYRLPPPSASFAVSHVRVDLLANGTASCVLGDPAGCFTKASPLYEHSRVQLDVHIAQQVNGVWHEWPLVSDTLFGGKGDYVTQIRVLLSGQTYPRDLALRKADVGGGEILCHLQVACSILPIGREGRVSVDFGATDAHGIFVGGVALIGGFV